MTSRKTILTYGTFDLFHIGHLRLIKRLKELGDKLIVGVSTDEFNAEKGKKTIIPFEQRAEVIESINGVDLVIPEISWAQKPNDIKKYNVDIFAMGSDWEGKFDELRNRCQVIYLPRTKGVSSTKVRQSLTKFLSISQEEVEMALGVLKQIREDLE